MTSVKDSPFFCSWSGGKDSSLALYGAIRKGARPRFLLTVLTENGERSRSHGLSVALIRKQSLALGIPLVICATSWNDYEATFISALQDLKKEGIEMGVFGDIDIDAHREWVERVCSAVTIRSYFPLWKKERQHLLGELFDAGFKATIVAVKNGMLDKRFLGKVLDRDIARKIKKAGVDSSGEKGEYHTVVTDGPIFSTPLYLDMKGCILRDGYWFLDVSAITADAPVT